MALLTYQKDIHMIMIDHAIGDQMIKVISAAGTMDMRQEENKDYGEKVYETACRLAATTLVLVRPDSIIAHQVDMATLYETFRMHGGPLWSMLPTTISVEIFNSPFRFKEDPSGEPLCLDMEWKARRREHHEEGQRHLEGVRELSLQEFFRTWIFWLNLSIIS